MVKMPTLGHINSNRIYLEKEQKARISSSCILLHKNFHPMHTNQIKFHIQETRYQAWCS